MMWSLNALVTMLCVGDYVSDGESEQDYDVGTKFTTMWIVVMLGESSNTNNRRL